MPDAADILFNTLFDGRPIFESQQDLVNQLINSEESGFYTSLVASDYPAQINRLKAYISQLLSPNVSRNITPIFRHSLEVLVRKRLLGSQFRPNEITEKILISLINKNKNPISKSPVASSSSNASDLFANIYDSTYILIITARPLDINNGNTRFSFQDYLIKDFLSSLENVDSVMKFYRFNFPLESLCELFWIALKKRIEKILIDIDWDGDFLKKLNSKSIITIEQYLAMSSKKIPLSEEINVLANLIIEYITLKKYVLVFLVNSPIFSVPMVILNPADSQRASAYIILENGLKITQILKLSIEDTLTWKFFVYDKMKTQNSGSPIYYRI